MLFFNTARTRYTLPVFTVDVVNTGRERGYVCTGLNCSDTVTAVSASHFSALTLLVGSFDPQKPIPDVFGGTLSLTQSINQSASHLALTAESFTCSCHVSDFLY